MFKRFVLFAAVCLPVAAQDDWCSPRGFSSNDLITHAEVRNETIAGAGDISVNPEKNGSIKLHGWGNNTIQIKACVRAAAENESAAEALAKQVSISDGAGRVVAKGPQGRAAWSVSYEIWAPSAANFNLESFNGSISADSIAGHIQAHALNGSIRLKGVTNNVDVSSTNGSVTADVAGGFHGEGIGLKTTNGSIHLDLPASLSAQVGASTVNGSVKTDFPVEQQQSRHEMNFSLGSGGAKVEARTVNGSVHISRI